MIGLPFRRIAPARAFGCARVVYNDALRTRREAYAAGEKASDTDVQWRVVTEAKKTAVRDRAKARLKVAKAHAKVRDSRTEWAHKQSTAIIRDNQAV